jgi:outer membrane protein TolC
VTGPNTYFDLRVTLTQNVVDMTAINNHRASQEVVKANEQSVQDARDAIVLATGGAYLQTIAAKARVEAAKAQLETAKAFYQQTLQRRQAGIMAQIDVNRSLVQERTQEQRIATLENDLARQKINLARIAGLPANDNYDIADTVVYSAPPALTVEDALKQSLEARPDLKAAEAQVRAAERARVAARAERLPSVALSADIGEIGQRFNEGKSTYTVVGSVRIPIWQGGKAAGDIEQSEAVVDQRRAELTDVRGRIESDIRNAFLDLQAATSQMDLAHSNEEVARETLRLTKEKFDAGVSESLEVTQAEDAVASAVLDQITALFQHNLAKLSLARALGHAESKLGDYLKVR